MDDVKTVYDENKVKDKNQNTKIFMHDEEDPLVPEAPNNLDPGKSDSENLDTKVNCLKNIERRLTKLKFFNQTRRLCV